MASATLKIWDTLGVFQDPREIVAWVNYQEHGGVLADEVNLRYLNELIHHSYFYVAEGDRETFLAAWSVALFEQRTLTDKNKVAYNVEGRTFEFLDKILTPFDPAQNTHVFFTDDS